ncbi:hypothetical protein BIY20_20125 [Vibrio panuliri]|uniref:Uncharacterized protein n=1 Tax=Vibrio panuliri TaxID=1381081 RepID=A0ABX3FQ94_9VIBR|nr:hypothetical protein BIY20_20125 [Vibrio panuliri]
MLTNIITIPIKNTTPECVAWKANSALLAPVNNAYQKKGQNNPSNAMLRPARVWSEISSPFIKALKTLNIWLYAHHLAKLFIVAFIFHVLEFMFDGQIIHKKTNKYTLAHLCI